MSRARIRVRALVVTDGRAGDLAAVVQAVAESSRQPDFLHIVATQGATVRDARAHHSQTRSYGDAVAEVLAEYPADEDEYLWLLHDDSIPEPDALSRLIAVARKRHQAGVVGPVHVRSDNPDRLVNLGVTVSRWGARRVPLISEDDINQGQYDERDDVLAVSLAGALVSRAAWDTVEGLGAAYQGFGESVDFCRRLWSSGYDVVLAPQARVRHSQENLHGNRYQEHYATIAARRRLSDWQHALTWAPAWYLLPLFVLSVVAVPFRALWRFTSGEIRRGFAELAVPFRLVGRFPCIAAGRARNRRIRQRPRSAITPLLASPVQVLNYLRVRELGARDRAKALAAPSELERQELENLKARARQGWLMLTAVTVIATVLLWRGWLAEIARGKMLTSELLGSTSIDTVTLLRRTWTGLQDEGFGAPAIEGTWSGLLLPFSVLPGGTRLAIGLLLSLSLVFAAWAAWLATGVLTRQVRTRVLLSLVYGLWPMHIVSVEQGRWGAVIAHILLPLVVLGIARGIGLAVRPVINGREFPRKAVESRGAAAGAGLAAALAVVASPVLLLPLVLAFVVVGLYAGSLRLRVWAGILPMLAVSLSWLVKVPEHGLAILLRESGPSAWARPVSTQDLLMGVVPGTQGEWGSLAAVLSGILVLSVIGAAILSALFSRQKTVAAWAVLTTGTALFLAGYVQTVEVAAGSTGWPGPLMSLAALASLVAIAASQRVERVSGKRVWSAIVGATAALLVSAWVIVLLMPGQKYDGGLAARSEQFLPTVASLEQSGPFDQRVLRLSRDDDVVTYSLYTRDGWMPALGHADVHNGENLADSSFAAIPAGVLDDVVAGLASARASSTQVLTDLGIGVVVTDPRYPDLAETLSRVADLSVIGVTELGTAYRVGNGAARAWVSGNDDLYIPLRFDSRWQATQQLNFGPERTLYVANAASDGWQVRWNGRELEPTGSDPLGRMVFELPQDLGLLDVRYHDADYRRWWWIAVAAFAWSAFAAIPLPGRKADVS